MTDEIIEIHKIKVTPDLPIEAKREIAAWKKSSIYNQVFICVLEQFPNSKCKNCGDIGSIYVLFIRGGPFQNPPGHRVDEKMTWFEGNEMAGKGWYIITETKCYPCHMCPPSTFADRPAEVATSEVQARIAWLAEEKSIGEDLE